MTIRIQCRNITCGKIAEMSNQYSYCPHCGANYSDYGIDVADLFKKLKDILDYRFKSAFSAIFLLLILWSAFPVALHLHWIESVTAGYFFIYWFFSIYFLWVIGLVFVERFMVRRKFGASYDEVMLKQ